MPSTLDWLGVSPAPQTSLLNPAIPYRTYGLTASDAVMQGRDALSNMQSAAQYADIIRQQQLAPLQQQATQQQLQNQIETQPLVNAGRDDLIQAISALDPTQETYLQQRRDAVMKNPYGLSDPVVQQVLRTNDQAYDDYISTRRLEMYGMPRALTPTQQATMQRQLSRTTAELAKADAMGDAVAKARLEEEIDSLRGLLAGNSAEAPAVAAEPAFAPQTASAAPAANKLAIMPEEQRWQSSKEALLSAILKEAQELQTTPAEIMRSLEENGDVAKEFFQRYVGAAPDAQVFKAEKGRNYFASSKVSWKNILESLREDESLINKVGVTQRDASNLPPVNATKDAPDNFTPGQWHLEVITE